MNEWLACKLVEYAIEFTEKHKEDYEQWLKEREEQNGSVEFMGERATSTN